MASHLLELVGGLEPRGRIFREQAHRDRVEFGMSGRCDDGSGISATITVMFSKSLDSARTVAVRPCVTRKRPVPTISGELSSILWG